MTTEMSNISIVLPPVFESPGPRYGNFLTSRLRVRVDDQPWRELTMGTARPETILAESDSRNVPVRPALAKAQSDKDPRTRVAEPANLDLSAVSRAAPAAASIADRVLK